MKGPSFPAARRTLLGAERVFLALSVMTLSVFAQSERSNTNTSQAVLHIRVNVVPTIMSSQQARSQSAGDTVAYHIPVDPAKTSVTIDLQPLPTATGQDGVLKTTTIVAR